MEIASRANLMIQKLLDICASHQSCCVVIQGGLLICPDTSSQSNLVPAAEQADLPAALKARLVVARPGRQ